MIDRQYPKAIEDLPTDDTRGGFKFANKSQIIATFDNGAESLILPPPGNFSDAG